MGIILHGVRDTQMQASEASVIFERPAANGSLLRDVRARKRAYQFAVGPITKQREKVLMCLLRGGAGSDSWHYWTGDDATYYAYSNRNLTNATGTIAQGTTTPSPKFGDGYLDITAGITIDTGWTSTEWTVMGWQYDAGDWQHVIKNSNGDVWENGTLELSPTYGWNFSGGVLTAGINEVDDLVLLPVELDDDDVQELISLTEAFGNGGHAINWLNPSNSQLLYDSSIVAVPQWEGSSYKDVDIDNDGTLEPCATISFSLREV